MMNRFVYNHKGFSIIELSVAAIIMSLIVVGILTVDLMTVTAWREGGVQLTLQRKAGVVMEKMVRGIDGLNGIREAGNINIPNNNTILYVSGINAIQRSFSLVGNDIMYDPDTAVAGNEFSIADMVNNLNFAINGDVVTITLGMRERVRDTNIDALLTTQIMIRN